MNVWRASKMLLAQMLLLASALKPPLKPLVRTHYSARSVVRRSP